MCFYLLSTRRYTGVNLTSLYNPHPSILTNQISVGKSVYHIKNTTSYTIMFYLLKLLGVSNELYMHLHFEYSRN